MKKLHILAISLVSLLAFNVSNAFVYQMELWQDDKKNTVITMSDYHKDTLLATTTIRQKSEIIDLAKKLGAYGIFEDMNGYTGTNTELREHLNSLAKTEEMAQELVQERNNMVATAKKNSPSHVKEVEAIFSQPCYSELIATTPLVNLTAYAQKNNINCESIEFRQGVINQKYDEKISIHKVYDELNCKINEIAEKCSVDNEMQRIYKIYDELNMSKFGVHLNEKFECHKNQNTQSSSFSFSFFNSIQEKIQQEQEKLRLLKKEIAEDGHLSHLIDIEILYALHRQLMNGTKTFIICAGGAHIERITKYGLEEMGFNQKAKIIGKNPKVTGEAQTLDAQLLEKAEREALKDALNITKTYNELNSNQLSGQSTYTSCTIQ